MTQEIVDKDVVSLLKIDDRGWNISLFEDKNRISASLCEYCKSVCCDAVELGCDHDDNEICSYCKECLIDLVKHNENKCPINQHDNPVISPVRSVRRQILKSLVICPYSIKYKQQQLKMNDKNNDGNVVDTIGYDEKEGIAPQNNEDKNNKNIEGCNWTGTLNDLITKHLSECVAKYEPSFTRMIKIKKLETENTKLKQIIDEQLVTNNKLNKENQELKNIANDYCVKLNKCNENNQWLMGQLSNSKKQIEELKQKLNAFEEKKEENVVQSIKDKWDRKYINKIKNNVSVNGNCIKVLKNADKTHCYGTHVVTAGNVYTWILKLVHYGTSSTSWYHPYIGIIKDAESTLNSCQGRLGWHRNDNGYQFCASNKLQIRPGDKKYGEPFNKNGSVMKMTLDTINWTLSYNINGKDYGIAFDNIIQQNYRLCVAPSVKDTEIEII
eukprot:513226_1